MFNHLDALNLGGTLEGHRHCKYGVSKRTGRCLKARRKHKSFNGRRGHCRGRKGRFIRCR